MTSSSQKPRKKIEQNNFWYVNDQCVDQCHDPAKRWTVHKRWQRFQEIIHDWRKDKRIGTRAKINVLDAGCGDGINLLGLKQILPACQLKGTIHGVDINPLRLSRASSNLVEPTGSIDLLEATLVGLPVSDETYHVVICNQVLEHIPRHQAVLRELGRVLSSDGILILCVPNEGCLMAQLRNRFFQPRIRTHTDHVHFFTSRELSEDVRTTGLKIKRIERTGFFMPYLRLQQRLASCSPGRFLLSLFQSMFPGQSSELMMVLTK